MTTWQRAWTPAFRLARAAACGVLLAFALHAGVPVSLAQPAPAPPAPQAVAETPDPLGRDTPLGAVTGFSRAVHRGELMLASRYLQLGTRSARQGEALSEDLGAVLDRYFTRPLTSLSAAPNGRLDDGLPADREKVTLTVGEREVDLFLVRVREPGQGSVWLVSSESLAQVPDLHRQERGSWLEERVPGWLQRGRWLGATPAQWLLWAGSLLLPLAAFWGLARLLSALATRMVGRATMAAWAPVRRPLVLLLALGTHLALLPLLGFSITFRFAYTRWVVAVGILLVALVAWRVLAASFGTARSHAQRRGRADTRSLILLGERVAKVVVVVIAALLLLTLAGVDTRTALAGVGIGGIALALGAQKSIENLLGGVFLLTDKALAVGDFCRVADRLGWVEDVTLRSVRLRTLEQTLLSVPAGQLAQGSIENFSTRRQILMQHVLRIRHGATVAQLQDLIGKVRAALAEHPLVAQENARFRLVAYGPQAIELELFAYITTADLAKFLAVQEQLLMRIATLVERSGAQFAQPTSYIYLPSAPTVQSHWIGERTPAALQTG